MDDTDLSALPLFSPEDNSLVCQDVRLETHDVRTFCFAGVTPCRFSFRPGQYMTLQLEIDGRPINRCYTIASPPTRPHRISLTIKRVGGGPVSNWMHDQMRPGMIVRALGPFGDFSNAGHASDKLLFLSGGSGITPLMSMARSLADLAGSVDLLFVHSARSPRDIIFRSELDLMARQLPGLRVQAICEDDSADETWTGFRGRLSPAMFALLAPDLLERRVFTCGPSPYMAAIRDMLATAGFDMRRYHEESFAFGQVTPSPAPIIAPTATASRFRVEFSRSRKTLDCDGSMSILAAAGAAGMRLPFSCTKGVCGTCKSKLISGQVAMNHAGGIRQREIDQGQILMCCSTPLSDLLIDR